MKSNRQYIIIADKNFLGCDLFIKHNIGAAAVIVCEDFIQDSDIQQLILTGAIKVLPVVSSEYESKNVNKESFIPDPIVSQRPKGRPSKKSYN